MKRRVAQALQAPPGSIIQVSAHSGAILDQAGQIRGTLERLFADLKPNTLRAYQRAWDVLASYLDLPSRIDAAAFIATFTEGQANSLAMQWIADMKREDVKTPTIAARLSALKGIARRMRIAGLLGWSISVKGPAVTKYKDTAGPGTPAIVSVLEALGSRTDLKAIRDLALIKSIYSLGLRRSELANLRISDLELDKNRISITGKGKDDCEYVTIRDKSKAAIEAWLRVRPPGTDAVFVSLDPAHYGEHLSDNGVYRITISYGLGRPHGMRHSGITEVLRKSNGNIRMAQEFSRHKDPKTLLLYDDNLKDLGGEASGLLEEDL